MNPHTHTHWTDSLGIVHERRTDVVRTAELKLYPGWTARIYGDGSHDAIHVSGIACRPRKTWRGMLDELNHLGHKPDTDVRRARLDAALRPRTFRR